MCIRDRTKILSRRPFLSNIYFNQDVFLFLINFCNFHSYLDLVTSSYRFPLYLKHFTLIILHHNHISNLSGYLLSFFLVAHVSLPNKTNFLLHTFSYSSLNVFNGMPLTIRTEIGQKRSFKFNQIFSEKINCLLQLDHQFHQINFSV